MPTALIRTLTSLLPGSPINNMHTGSQTFPFEKKGDIMNSLHSTHKEQEIGMLRLTNLKELRTATWRKKKQPKRS
jgi:hypothetical protein